MKFIKYLLIVVFTAISSLVVKADEGMWLPLLLEKLNEKKMKSLGMKISAKDIYNINTGSLKDAIVSLGGFCTGELISSKGLILTNHHCGFDVIQNHSTIDNNYIKHGFWARNSGEELPNPGLYVTFIVRMQDVTREALNGVTATMPERERQSAIDKNINQINGNAKMETYQRSLVRPFFEGNQYFQFITETYNDVRLAGAPPSSIGNFGKDSDNWMWPRHTGDFSLFRIYAGKDNKPANYSPDNVPYVPKKFLSISLDGVAEKDFTMVFGFPGRTNQYLHSEAVKQVVEINDPAKVSVRDKALEIMDGFMRKDEQIQIQYAAKYSSISNYWKKWRGEILGLTKTNAVEKKKIYEAGFQQRVDANPQWKASYGSILENLESAYREFEPYGQARDYHVEIFTRIELFVLFSQLDILKNNRVSTGKNIIPDDVKEKLENLYHEYSPQVDKKLMETLMPMYISEKVKTIPDFSKWADEMYNSTDFDDAQKIIGLVNQSRQNADAVLGKLADDKVYQFYRSLVSAYTDSIAPKVNAIQNRINQLQRIYMQAQMDVFKEKTFYPDANSTLRVTYGKVQGYVPRDAARYDYYTYLDGVMEKYLPGDYEFDVPQKLRELYAKKDFGPYGKNGKMPVCFIAANHTTGGNSGSPALDAYGNLVGLNFDRVWEGTMSDINYDPSICRNIMVDIRYVLFIIDKYAGAGHLVKEMKLVRPKSGVKR